MDKLDTAGVEVSVEVLVIALKSNGQMRASEFPNTPSGHKQLIGYLRRHSQRLRIVWNPPDCMVWTWPWHCRRKREWKSWWPIRARCGTLPKP